MILLRNLDTCKLEADVQKCYQIYHIALGFVMRLCLLANDLLEGTFEQVKACCGATRNASRTPKLMGNLASFLGQILAEIRHLREYARSFPNVSSSSIDRSRTVS